LSGWLFAQGSTAYTTQVCPSAAQNGTGYTANGNLWYLYFPSGDAGAPGVEEAVFTKQ
jgi:hypothetical protein